MKKNILLLLILFLSNNWIKSQPSESLQYEWIQDTKLEYDEIRGFKNNVAVFVRNNKYGLINHRGAEITTQLYDELSISENNSLLVSALLDGKYGIISLSGKTIVAPIYDYCQILRDLIIVEKDGKSKLLSKDGQPMLDNMEFDVLTASENGMIVFQQKGKWGLINKMGVNLNEIKNCKKIGQFKEGLARVENKDGKIGYINKEGKTKIEFNYFKGLDFSGGLVQVQRSSSNKTWGYINKNNVFKIQARYDKTKPFKDNCAIVRKGEKWGIVGIGREKQPIIPINYEAIASLGEKRFKVKSEGLWAIFDNQGTKLTDFKYKDVGNECINGLIKVTNSENRKGALSREGQEIISLVYDEVSLKKGNMVYVSKSGKLGCYDTLKQSIASVMYHKIDFFSEGLAAVKNQHGYGYIDLRGNRVIDNSFKKVTAFNNGIAAVQGNNGKWGIIQLIKDKPSVKNQISFIEPNELTLIGGRAYLTDVPMKKIKITVIMNTPIANKNCVLDFYCEDCTNPVNAKSKEGSIFGGEKVQDFYVYNYEALLKFEEEGTYYARLDIYKNDKLKKKGNSIKIKYASRNSDLHLIAIGTTPAADSSDLQYIDEDAKDLIQLFEGQEGSFYDNVYSYELIKKNAPAISIDAKLNMLNEAYQRNEIEKNDVILFFFSGHGYLDDNETFYIQPYGFNASSLSKSAISLNEIYNKLDAIECKKIIIIDACKSGTNIGDGKHKAPNAKDGELIQMEEVIQKFDDSIHNDWTLMTSSGDEKSYENANYSNGIFTEALLLGLNGLADKNRETGGNNDGYVTIQELFNYVEYRVKELSDAASLPAQYPKMNTSEQNKTLRIFKN